MDANPSNRPNASDIYKNLLEWYGIIDDNVANNKNELTILKAFKSADVIIPTLSTELPNYSKDKLTNKHLNSQNLNSCDSGIYDLSIDNYISSRNKPNDFIYTKFNKFIESYYLRFKLKIGIKLSYLGHLISKS
ncbi:7437_t:CDS:2 [Gigaspora margarita]|uniref:7437_t:CDS:1 n=1 Tax=Gigaspora margarita TaxID=4874 RepID=A0ABN7W5Z1_GIGMA|nr:7437_t:CDS:2 [Gigaspora margarita]